jgi:acyl-CoA synthetase (AMP-forming)/AMP-acid ligase II
MGSVDTNDQIASQDVENAFYADKRIAEAAAIGVPDERLGELVGVIVSLHPSSSTSQVKESDLLASVKPRYVFPCRFGQRLIEKTRQTCPACNYHDQRWTIT